MRVNVYAEEITGEVKVVNKDGFIGVRFYLASANELHNTPTDDDRSAITFWGMRKFCTLLDGLRTELDRYNKEKGLSK